MSNTNDDNPFRVVDGYWAVRFVVPQAALPFAENAFEDVAVSVSTFEADEEGEHWQVEVLTEAELLAEEVTGRLDSMATLAKCKTPTFAVEYVKQKDWVSEVLKSFPPLHVGRYYIHGSHHEGPIPEGTLPIHIDAGMAFGSGEHETTSTCLEALDDLFKTHSFEHLLDMGCGSGILAIAMAKTWNKLVIAADIDPLAVDITRENAEKNGVAGNMQSCVSDGYKHVMIKKYAPYDIIVANILARPLIALAPDLAKHLAKDGVAVLSGLLGRQEPEVLAAHEAQGLRLKKRYAMRGWHTLVLSRN